MKGAGDVRGEEASQQVLKHKLLHLKIFQKIQANFKPAKLKIHKNMSPWKGHARSAGRTMEANETDVPLVGCLANDTENLFTGGIEKSSEEIREVTGVTGKVGPPGCPHDSFKSRKTGTSEGWRRRMRRKHERNQKGTAPNTPHFLFDELIKGCFCSILTSDFNSLLAVEEFHDWGHVTNNNWLNLQKRSNVVSWSRHAECKYSKSFMSYAKCL